MAASLHMVAAEAFWVARSKEVVLDLGLGKTSKYKDRA